MKKSLLLATVAAIAALCACTKTSVVPDQGALEHEIAIAPFNGPLTKAAIANTGVLPSAYTMMVSAFYNPVSGTGSSYFEGAPFTNTSSNNWTGSKYWPLSGTLDFLAYASGTAVISSPTWTWTTSEKKVVLTVGDNSTYYDDIVYGGAAAVTKGATTALSFNHAFAVAAFKFKSGTAFDSENNKGVKVNSVTVKNAYYGGELTISAPASPAASWGATLTNQKDFVAKNGDTAMSELTLGTSFTENFFGDAYVILPPQTAVNFEISYDLHNGKIGSTNSTLENLTYTYTQPTPSTPSWAMGSITYYEVTITPTEITIVPTVTNWTTGTTEVTVPSAS